MKLNLIKKISLKLFLTISIVFLAISCSQNNSQKSVRLVGIDGKTRPIETKTPALNAEIIGNNSSPIINPNFNNFASSNQRQIDGSASNLTMNNAQNISQNNQFPAIVRNDQKNFNSANRYNNQAGNQTNSASQFDNQMLQETLNSEQAKPIYKNLQGEVIVEKQLVDDSRMINQNNLVVADSQNTADSFEIDLAKDENSDNSLIIGDEKNQKKSPKLILQSGASAKNIEIVDNNLTGFFVQAGSFSESENAAKVMKKTEKIHKTIISEAEINDKKIYRVLIGPFATSKKAKIMLKKIKSSGVEAIVVNRK